MTKQECAIVEAFTGIAMLKGKDEKYLYQYVEGLIGRPVLEHEIFSLAAEIKEKARPDFINLCETAWDMDAVCNEMMGLLDESEFVTA